MKTRHFVFTLLLLLPLCAQSSTLSSSVYKKLERAQAQLQENQYQSVIDLLQPVIRRSKKQSLARAMSWQLIGHAYVSQNNYANAINAYEKALAQNTLKDTLKKSVVVNLGQLYINEKYYERGIELLNEFLKEDGNTNSNLHILIANAYYELKQFKAATPHVQQAIASSQRLEESWHQLLLTLYYEQKEYQLSAEQLEKMTQLFPAKKRYWKQLSSFYVLLKQEEKALKTLQLAWRKKILTEEKDLIDLANLYALQNLPYEAAEVLHDGLTKSQIIASTFKNWDRLAKFYLLAREQKKAISAMEKAMFYSIDAKNNLTLARIYMADEQWEKARAVLEQVDEAQESAASSERQYFLAIILFELEKYEKANVLFSKLVEDEKFSKKAKPWQVFLSSLE